MLPLSGESSVLSHTRQVTSQDTKTRPQKPPEKKIGPFAGEIGVAIWLNKGTGEDGSVRFFR
ncbi:MAG: hypothetical protein NT013_30515, partial [Planctomycetia bacterium]|nr:hypothetical protein [Planctomycetia bacterium]